LQVAQASFVLFLVQPGSLNCPENVGPGKRVRISLSTDGLFFGGSGWTEILSTFAIFQMQKTNQAGNVGVMLLEFIRIPAVSYLDMPGS